MNHRSERMREEYARDVRTYLTLLAQIKKRSLGELDRDTLRHYGAKLVSMEARGTVLEVDLQVAVTTVLFRNRSMQVKEKLETLQKAAAADELASHAPLREGLAKR